MTGTGLPSSPNGAGPQTTKRVLVLVGLVAFITALDNTVVNVALPTIGRDLGLSLSGLEWVSAGYILSFASQLLVGGWACDHFGRRRCLMAGLALFAAASLAAALSAGGFELIASRIVQGVGAALSLPAVLSIVALDLSGSDQQLGSGVLTAAIAAALSLGPVVGGALVELAGWGSVFVINLPVVVIAVVLASGLEPTPNRGGDRPPVDLIGLLSSTFALAALTWVLVQGGEHGYSSASVVTFAILGGLSTVWFIYAENKAEHPLVDVALFRNRVFSGGTAAQVLWGLGINGVFFFTSLFLQNVLRESPSRAGLAFVPLALAVIVMVPAVPALNSRLGSARLVAIGLLVVTGGLLALTQVPSRAGLAAVLPGLVLIGAGSGLTTSLTTAVLASFSPERAGIASATVSAAREMSGALGIALVGLIVTARETALRGGGISGSAAFVSGYRLGLAVSAGLVTIGAAVAALTLPGRERPTPVPAGSAG